jgi:hypothetical protein
MNESQTSSTESEVKAIKISLSAATDFMALHNVNLPIAIQIADRPARSGRIFDLDG